MLSNQEALQTAIMSVRSLREELLAACGTLAKNRSAIGVSPQETPIWLLLSDEVFQDDLQTWLMAGGIEEGRVAKDRLVHAMELALSGRTLAESQLDFLRTGYLDALEKAVFSNPVLAHWRHQLSLDFLREQVTVLRKSAEEAAGYFSSEKQTSALQKYCDKALEAWDIIDLSNLPEGDIHIATQKLLLRQLYMPLHILIDKEEVDGREEALARLERHRDGWRIHEAGRSGRAAPDIVAADAPRSRVGDLLHTIHRMVILGDPGGGKTTMLRWMATAYLLKLKADSAFEELPDTSSLPNRRLIPVLRAYPKTPPAR